MTDSVEDIRKKFKGTFCFLHLNGKRHLTEYINDDGGNRFLFKSPTFGEVLIDRETIDTSLTFKFPSNGLYNLQGEAVHFVRYPERQWKRAPYSDNCRISNILSVLGLHTVTDNSISLHNLDEIYQEKYPESLDKGIESLKISLALNKTFAISASPMENQNELLLWYLTQPIGIIEKDKKTICIKYLPLFQETQDFLNKSGYSSWLLKKQQQ